eukprot:CAMPEP_0118928204 /NCGR_PEP_ID=MMETSP1169-20130426/5513_1 /TAXON_ID=36882 /ORGANISM="Pyramimonas obovata, Strain CCMP722" /LENGTH=111 /DNA_ID=CAMNT_0006870127 /DNA_START=28 /DNA_END=363 /DNA_ORIENTATION=-
MKSCGASYRRGVGVVVRYQCDEILQLLRAQPLLRGGRRLEVPPQPLLREPERAQHVVLLDELGKLEGEQVKVNVRSASEQPWRALVGQLNRLFYISLQHVVVYRGPKLNIV